jgi:hypothetical protein
VKKNTITKGAAFAKPWKEYPNGDQFIDLEVFLDWLKETIQDAAPTSAGVQLRLCTVSTLPNLELSWEEKQITKTTKRVQKAISKIKRSKKGKKK